MVGMKLYVEGGGDTHLLRTACRKGFHEFLKKAGLAGCMPRVIACGGRKQAYDDFCTALCNGESAMLLVDSEGPVDAQFSKEPQKPWQHLKNRPGDQWSKPTDASDDHCHLMVQCMETWFLADHQTLKAFFGQGFNGNALPEDSKAIEDVDKEKVYQSLESATKKCKTKAPYGKGEHSFKLLEQIDPAKVTEASAWAKRFVETLKEQMKP